MMKSVICVSVLVLGLLISFGIWQTWDSIGVLSVSHEIEIAIGLLIKDKFPYLLLITVIDCVIYRVYLLLTYVFDMLFGFINAVLRCVANFVAACFSVFQFALKCIYSGGYACCITLDRLCKFVCQLVFQCVYTCYFLLDRLCEFVCQLVCQCVYTCYFILKCLCKLAFRLLCGFVFQWFINIYVCLTIFEWLCDFVCDFVFQCVYTCYFILKCLYESSFQLVSGFVFQCCVLLALWVCVSMSVWVSVLIGVLEMTLCCTVSQYLTVKYFLSGNSFFRNVSVKSMIKGLAIIITVIGFVVIGCLWVIISKN